MVFSFDSPAMDSPGAAFTGTATRLRGYYPLLNQPDREIDHKIRAQKSPCRLGGSAGGGGRIANSSSLVLLKIEIFINASDNKFWHC